MPPLTIENAGALVGGDISSLQRTTPEENQMQAAQKPALPKDQKIKVLRSFYYGGKPLEKGSTHTVPYLFALEQKTLGRAEFVVDVAPQPAAPEAKKSEELKGAQKDKR